MSGFIVASIASVGALVACGDDDDATLGRTAATATVAAADPIATPAVGPQSTGAEVSVPADLPRDAVPLPSADVALRSASGSAPGPWILIYAVDADVPKVVSAYRDQLTAGGFELQDEAAAGALVSSFAADGVDFSVTAIGSGAGGSVGSGMVVTVTQAP